MLGPGLATSAAQAVPKTVVVVPEGGRGLRVVACG